MAVEGRLGREKWIGNRCAAQGEMQNTARCSDLNRWGVMVPFFVLERKMSFGRPELSIRQWMRSCGLGTQKRGLMGECARVRVTRNGW